MGRPFRKRTIYKPDRLIIAERDQCRCVNCGKQLSLNHSHCQITIDGGQFHHVLPHIYGGTSLPENVCVLCNECHIAVHSGPERVEKYVAMKEVFMRTGRIF